MVAAWKAAGFTYVPPDPVALTHRIDRNSSYNKYLSIAARAIRRSLKEEQRLKAERREQIDLRFSLWQARMPFIR
jgi:hypothetical protein